MRSSADSHNTHKTLRRARQLVLSFVAGVLAFLAFVIAGAVAVEGAAGVPRPAIDAGAHALVTADRGTRVQTRPIPPPPGPPPCARVIVIGDSLMDNARPWLNDGLRDAGFTRLVDAHHSRRIPAFVNAPYSGVKAALNVRAAWGEAECWVIALGSNDLSHGANTPAAVSSMLDEMLRVVTPGAHVWWVNIDYHRDPRTSFNFVGATAVFNETLDSRAASDPKLHVIDWYSYAEANLHWFFDPVHVDRTGSIARANQVVDALPR